MSSAPNAQAPRRSHLPAAANLATLSSDLQFANPPEFTIGDSDADTDANKVLETIMHADRVRAQFNVYGEMKAALGGTVTVAMWDADVAPGEVWCETFGVDTAIPEFQSGRLSAVTLWSEAIEGQTHYRLLSRHAVENGVGYIEHALYRGKAGNIGTRIPLAEHPLGEPYADLVNAESRVLTGLTRLDAVYSINAPTVEWRRDPVLRYAGRSDFAQLHGLFDDLDRVWNSLLRDVRLGVGRTFIPEAYMQSLGRGQGAAFDELAEYVTQVRAPGSADGSSIPIHSQQHAIRVEQHSAALTLTYGEILKKAGYSPSSWGENDATGGEMTAREVEDRNAASERTRGKKNLHDRQALGELARIMYEVHSVQYGGGLKKLEALPIVEFPEMSQASPRELAETVQLLDAAGAISLLEKVARVNPQWTRAQVLEEVELIRTSQGLDPVDPAALDRVMNNLADGAGDDEQDGGDNGAE